MKRIKIIDRILSFEGLRFIVLVGGSACLISAFTINVSPTSRMIMGFTGGLCIGYVVGSKE